MTIFSQLFVQGFKRFVLYHKMCGPLKQGRCHKATKVPKDDLSFLGETGFCHPLCPKKVEGDDLHMKTRHCSRYVEMSPKQNPQRENLTLWGTQRKHRQSYKWDFKQDNLKSSRWASKRASTRHRVKMPRSVRQREPQQNYFLQRSQNLTHNNIQQPAFTCSSSNITTTLK